MSILKVIILSIIDWFHSSKSTYAVNLIKRGLALLEKEIARKGEHLNLVNCRIENLLDLKTQLVNEQANIQSVVDALNNSHPTINNTPKIS